MMIGETNQTSIIVGDAAASGSKSATGAESEVASASSSSNVAVQTTVKKEVPKLYEYWKASTTTEKDFSAYRARQLLDFSSNSRWLQLFNDI
jgi:hypothetical protein